MIAPLPSKSKMLSSWLTPGQLALLQLGMLSAINTTLSPLSQLLQVDVWLDTVTPYRCSHSKQVQPLKGTATPCRFSPTQVSQLSAALPGATRTAPLQQRLWPLISVPSLMDLVNSIQQTGEGGSKCVRFSKSKDFSASVTLMVCYTDLDKCCFQLIDQGDLFSYFG